MTRTMKVFLFVLVVAAFCIAATTATARTNERLIPVSGSDITLKLWDEPAANGETATKYEILQNGQSVRTASGDYQVRLKYGIFDPLKDGVPAIQAALAADENAHLYIVQFVTQPLVEFQNEITRLGGTVRHYLPMSDLLVEMSDAVRAQVAQLPYVRWIGPYQPAYRLDKDVRGNMVLYGDNYPSVRYHIQVLDPSQKAVVADRLNRMGVLVNNPDAGKFLVDATMSLAQVAEVAHWDQVNWIDIWGPMSADMDITRQISGANYLEQMTGFSGEDVRGEIFDEGFQTAHVDFQLHPLILHGSVGLSSHGTACTGINFGTGTGNAQARGLCPDGQGVVAAWQTWGLNGPNRYTETMQLLQPPYRCLYQTSSVGDPLTLDYTSISAEADAWCFDSDIIHCQSQSNYGSTGSRPQAWAKNTVSVGGVTHYNTLTRSDDQWTSASIGPAADHRIKPNLWHFYDMNWTTYSTSTTGYNNFSGTSNATPTTAGCFGLFFQMWDAGIFGNTVNPDSSVFFNRPHSTTARAMMNCAAYQYPFTGQYDNKTRTHQGWGMPDLQYMYDHRFKTFFVDESVVLLPFQTHQHLITVDPNEPELKICMVYADPPGTPSSPGPDRVNDLTLKVTAPNGTVYWGNNGLYDGCYSVAGGLPDTLNTEECVFVQNPTPGQWTLEVQANQVIQDNHRETPAIDADYALVAMGVAATGTFNIDVTLTPNNPPIVIPANGGSFTFDANVINNGPNQTLFNVWTKMKQPDGTWTPTIMGPVPINPPVGTAVVRNRTQNIPSTYQPGLYYYVGYAALNYGGAILDSSYFTFTKSTTADGGPFMNNAENYGEAFPYQVNVPVEAPHAFELMGNYPNPFNPTTTITFTLGEKGYVKLAVYDVTGRLVATLVDGYRDLGKHQVTFDGAGLASGVYLYTLSQGNLHTTGKMVLMK